MRFNIFLMTVIACLGMSQILFAGDMEDINALMDVAKNQKIKTPVIQQDEHAEDTAAVFHSRDYQRKLQERIEALKQRLQPQGDNPDRPSISRKETNQNYFLMPDERIYVFASSSMPVSTLKAYASDLDKLKDPNIVMVLRGFVGGIRLIKPTLAFIDGILVKSPNCDPTKNQCEAYQANISIDPAAFSRYGIQAVPAIVYARGVYETEAGQGTEDNIEGDAFLVSGDMSLEYGLEMILKKTQSSQLNPILKKLRRGFY